MDFGTVALIYSLGGFLTAVGEGGRGSDLFIGPRSRMGDLEPFPGVISGGRCLLSPERLSAFVCPGSLDCALPCKEVISLS